MNQELLIQRSYALDALLRKYEGVDADALKLRGVA